MGQEAQVHATWQGTTSPGKALLEGDHLLFRGEFRVRMPFADLIAADVTGDDLCLTGPEGCLTLELGAQRAANWLHRIRHPKSLLDKLGLKPGQKLALIGDAPDPVLTAELARGGFAGDHPADGADWVLLLAGSVDDLAIVPKLAAMLAPKAGLWILYPKSRRDIAEADVRTAARGAGWVDNKVCAVSPTVTALKFVRRKV